MWLVIDSDYRVCGAFYSCANAEDCRAAQPPDKYACVYWVDKPTDTADE